jgi:conjugative relaxase-like TrwC/TraI family protein
VGLLAFDSHPLPPSFVGIAALARRPNTAEGTTTPETSKSGHGQAADELGLRGPVRALDFSALLAEVHPRKREVLVAARLGLDKRRAGWDFQISADKAVSIVALVGGDRRLVKAHDAAVRVAVNAVERCPQAWVKEGRETERTGRIIAGIFPHESSRNLDPHLHPMDVANGAAAGSIGLVEPSCRRAPIARLSETASEV